MGKKIRLLALDLDGTLLNGAKQITPRTQAALERARQHRIFGDYLYCGIGMCKP